jgi:hypothetical protein
MTTHVLGTWIVLAAIALAASIVMSLMLRGTRGWGWRCIGPVVSLAMRALARTRHGADHSVGADWHVGGGQRDGGFRARTGGRGAVGRW